MAYTKEFFAKTGRKGGKAKGKSKLRGGPEYYSAVAKKRWDKARKKKEVSKK